MSHHVALCDGFNCRVEQVIEQKPNGNIQAVSRGCFRCKQYVVSCRCHRVDSEAGENEVGCCCTHLSVTSDGNADRVGVFGGLPPHFIGWVADSDFKLNRWVALWINAEFTAI